MSAEDKQADYERRLFALSDEQRGYLLRKLSIPDAAPQSAARAGRLAACIRPQPGCAPAPADLARFARERLPGYMVPQEFHLVEDFARTPAGKIDRAALRCPAREKAGTDHGYEELASDPGFAAPRNPAEETLAAIWAEVLGADSIGIHDDFYEVGGDSLLSIRILARANKAGLRISPEDFFAYPTVAGQAAAIGEQVTATRGEALTEAGLSPIQHWFFDRHGSHPAQWNQSFYLRVPPKLDYSSLEPALRTLMAHHQQLRVAFPRRGGSYRQVDCGADAPIPLERIDLSGSAVPEVRAALESEANRLNRELDLERGELVKLLFAQTHGSMDNALLVVIHHLLVDAESWRTLLADLESLWLSASRGEKPSLAEPGATFLQWCRRLEDYANSPQAAGELGFWNKVHSAAAADIPLDFAADGNDNTNGSVGVVSVSLSAADTTALLTGVPGAYHTEISDALLSALLAAAQQWSGRPSLLVDVEGHGREYLFDDLDISRTVGWFTTVYPVALSARPFGRASELLLQVKESLRKVPRNGIGHGILRYLRTAGADGPSLAGHTTPLVCFNYLGQVDRLQSHSGEIAIESGTFGATRHPQARRAYQLEINTRIVAGTLQLDCIYSKNLHARSSIETLAQHFLDYLRDLAGESGQSDAEVHTPSDFSLAEVDQDELDAIANILSDADEETP